MSQVKIQGDPSGTGIFTIAAPNSNTSRTMTLPQQDGALFVNPNGALNINASTPANTINTDASGNVGIGTSSPSYGLHVANAVDAKAAGQFERTGGSVVRIAPEGVEAKFGTFSNHPLEFFTNSTERARIASDGKVGIGTASPDARVEIQSGSSATINTSDIRGVTALTLSGSDPGETGASNGVALTFRPIEDRGAVASIFVSNEGSNKEGGASMRFYTGSGVYPSTAVERARIDSSGNWLFNKTSTAASGSGVCFQTNDTSQFYRGGDGQAIQFFRSSSQVGSISVTGTATAYNTSSDYRLKEEIAPMIGALAKVAALKPVTYKWKLDGSAGEGFIAHELQAVVPGCVTGEKDAVETYIDENGNEQTRPVYQGIDTSFLVATLTAAIQELKAELDSVKAELAALKGATA